MTERQRARRRRILDASTELAAAGGFDAVQMRDVAESAEVAIGTLYRYFPSKIHLLLAVLDDQLERLRATLRERPLTERDPAERLAHTLKRAFRSHQREPRLAQAMMRALQLADASAREEFRAVTRLTTALLVEASGLPEAEAARRLSAIRVIAHTWHSSLLYWVSGNATLAEAHEDIETACRLLAGDAAPIE
ncbi:TetR family transcriptional regulator [Streptomyces radicis]|uniref:TetR/AcrR family transcriptional regulator n=1 Tax=Streptomyces radicis TaxID=1750517 RepID=A0A3A9WW99_9ACTN|nr:TetR family transcriptional regulator [Streptomyces radicis]RKN12086.1 TetR/AcrR family transcriptional regulator [Streptomyces radicis]RKN25861.1 TetR/AcrR family transcriptional regulator [Streptomyces radicis]